MNNDLLIDDILKEKANGEALKLPEDLNLKIKQTIEDLPKRKKSRKLAKRTAVAAAVTLVAFTGLSAAFPAYARNIPVVNSVFQFLSDKNMIDKEYVKYSSDLNLSKTSNGTTVTINSIAYDGIDLSIAYTVESEKELKFSPYMLEKDFKINGKVTSFGSGGTGKLINKNTYVGVDSFHVSNDYLPEEQRKFILGGDVVIPDNFTMDLSIKEFSDGTKGQWDFKFKVSLDQIKGKVKSVKTSIDLSKLVPNLKINEVIFTPMNTVLRTESDNGTIGESARYIIFDDKGRSLLEKGSEGSGSADTNKMYWQYNFKNIYDDTKSITFIPMTEIKGYKDKATKNADGVYELDSKSTQLNLNETTVLSEGKYGEYNINKVELLQDKTLIYYECTNLLPSLDPYGLVIKDENGNRYGLQKDVVKDQGHNKFVAEIEPLHKDKKYTISATDLEKLYDVREDLKFTVNVK
ncbi:DUF4179 domain-containing protein [Clostridium folliculivorans]|uniref:DUF4179 domain-containing protein n=1 Tax=Clostridium folliculivorans TaxID=2886038 RepID=A0A9W5Y094_9CLOT|nr:DUF4179 domain-containing protein [Clostridium folliculivorans]GKU24147.1 hypothetical protein CFOLD11_09730 [Clostridium folliculivorans]GKU30253.1 hypothetical protein CFB3_23600 [Clostridium folliculivorans]